ncbi:DUF1648 domain-containing protein [Paenibacillus polymyxa]|uniref:DUF1648 domain-containing protein n=1 Tax=Paenibacillus polymyxa TaxID=1406 RepID=UPI0007EB5249|nr:DUF1648 domain-containing protein [Paenibacillus polymyxa]OAZ49487.1 hypothetical protein A9Z39_12530 [Paenibacillus polymyxa]
MIKILFHPKTPVFVTVLAWLAAMIVVCSAPLEIPVHFMNGQADRFVSRWGGLFGFPALMTVLLIIRNWLDTVVRLIYVLVLLHIYMLCIALM